LAGYILIEKFSIEHDAEFTIGIVAYGLISRGVKDDAGETGFQIVWIYCHKIGKSRLRSRGFATANRITHHRAFFAEQNRIPLRGEITGA
jgi:hypothetical protein